MPGFDDFYNAIAGQESGGNYSAVNGRTGALGKFQILPSNIGPWAQQYLGMSMTPSQFLNSPALQEKLAKAVLKSYYDQWGARGAASAWYSGSPKNQDNYRKFNPNEPSIGEYVDQVLGRMGGGGGDFGHVNTKVTDNRTQQSSLQELVGQDQPAPQLDALAGVDRNGLGLQEVSAEGIGAATGGAGLAAPQMGSPAAPAGPQKAAVGETFQAAWDAAGEMVDAKGEGLRGAVIELAQQFVGTPYVWGGAAPGGFDCSGLIQYAMKQAGITFPRVSWDQIAAGKRTDVNSLKPGDLVGFGDGGHIAIWLGGNQILEAPRTGLDVRVRNLGKGENIFGVSLDSFYK